MRFFHHDCRAFQKTIQQFYFLLCCFQIFTAWLWFTIFSCLASEISPYAWCLPKRGVSQMNFQQSDIVITNENTEYRIQNTKCQYYWHLQSGCKLQSVHIALPTWRSDITRLGRPFLFVGHFKTIYHKFIDKTKKSLLNSFLGCSFIFIPCVLLLLSQYAWRGRRYFRNVLPSAKKDSYFQRRYLLAHFFLQMGQSFIILQGLPWLCPFGIFWY